jgi:putative Mn2+ efflux pump MntP
VLAAALLFFALGLDTLAVAISLGVARLPRERWWRVAGVFASFEGGMPIIGLLIGAGLAGVLAEVAGYAAAVLLIGVGVRELREALSGDDDDDVAAAVTARGRPIVLTALAVSLDELAAGFSLGVLAVPVGPALLYVAAQAVAFTFLGLFLGERAGARLGARAALASAVLLIVLGIALLVGEILGVEWL